MRGISLMWKSTSSTVFFKQHNKIVNEWSNRCDLINTWRGHKIITYNTIFHYFGPRPTLYINKIFGAPHTTECYVTQKKAFHLYNYFCLLYLTSLFKCLICLISWPLLLLCKIVYIRFEQTKKLPLFKY